MSPFCNHSCLFSYFLIEVICDLQFCNVQFFPPFQLHVILSCLQAHTMVNHECGNGFFLKEKLILLYRFIQILWLEVNQLSMYWCNCVIIIIIIQIHFQNNYQSWTLVQTMPIHPSLMTSLLSLAHLHGGWEHKPPSPLTLLLPLNHIST